VVHIQGLAGEGRVVLPRLSPCQVEGCSLAVSPCLVDRLEQVQAADVVGIQPVAAADNPDNPDQLVGAGDAVLGCCHRPLRCCEETFA